MILRGVSYSLFCFGAYRSDLLRTYRAGGGANARTIAAKAYTGIHVSARERSRRMASGHEIADSFF